MSLEPEYSPPTPAVIHAALDKILATAEFAASAQLSRILKYVVEESLAGRAERIKERNVAVHALDRHADFNPRLDPIVRVVAGKLRRALDRYHAHESPSAEVRIEIPKGSYRPCFTCLRNSSAQQSNILPLIETDSTLDKMGAGVVSMADVALARPVLAVLPLVPLTSGEQECLLADVIAQDVAVQLSKLGWLDIIGWLAGQRPLVKREHPLEIAKQLRAEFLLTGSVRRAGHRLRITAELLNVSSGCTVWADHFDVVFQHHDLTAADGIVTRITQTVGDLFGVVGQALWSRVQGKPIADCTVFESTLISFRYFTTVDDRMFKQAVKVGERALRANPDFAWGWAAQAQLYLTQYSYLAEGQRTGLEDAAQHCLKQAMRADPNCSYIQFVLGISHLFHGRVDETTATAERIASNDLASPAERGGAGGLLAMTGEHSRSQVLIDQALNINPRIPGYIRWGTVVNHLSRGEYRQAITATEQFSLPRCFWDPMLRAALLARVGERDKAQVLMQRAQNLRPLLAQRPHDLVAKLVQPADLRADLVDSVQSVMLCATSS